MFWIYYTAIASTCAFDRVQFTRGVSNAIALVFGKKDGLPDGLQSDLRDAYLLPPE